MARRNTKPTPPEPTVADAMVALTPKGTTADIAATVEHVAAQVRHVVTCLVAAGNLTEDEAWELYDAGAAAARPG